MYTATHRRQCENDAKDAAPHRGQLPKVAVVTSTVIYTGGWIVRPRRRLHKVHRDIMF